MPSFAIIAAGGLSTRMKLKSGESKQFLKLGRYPILYYTLSAFQNASAVDSIAIASHPEHIDALHAFVSQYGFSKVNHITEGGKERQDSIYNCIRLIETDLQKEPKSLLSESIVLIHDGARPFIQSHEINRIAELSLEFGACVPATKPKDTIKYISSNPAFFGETLERSKLLQVQTPQGFQAKLIFDAHHEAKLKQVYATDDAALVEHFFPTQKIKIFETGYHNIKITTPEDLDFGAAILKRIKN